MIIAVCIPFHKYDENMLHEKVFEAGINGDRHVIKKVWPVEIQDFLTQGKHNQETLD
jgi:hypothetical protein